MTDLLSPAEIEALRPHPTWRWADNPYERLRATALHWHAAAHSPSGKPWSEMAAIWEDEAQARIAELEAENERLREWSHKQEMDIITLGQLAGPAALSAQEREDG